MYLSHLTLSEFRNYRQLNCTLGPGLFLFYGENAQGKTNLLEAVSMLSTATSFHASSDREVVNWDAPDHIARLEATVIRHEGDAHIELVVFDPSPFPLPTSDTVQTPRHSIEIPTNTPRKRIKVNDLPRRAIDLIGQIKVVLFAPTDLHLVDGSPDERRRFLDRALCQLSPRYCQDVVKYRKVVQQRSALLKRIRDMQEDARLLDFLDDQLIALAASIIDERYMMVTALNPIASEFQAAISGKREDLQIVYRPSLHIDGTLHGVEVKQHYLEQLRGVRKKELLQGVCLLGPHRDDLEFVVNGVNMLTYGSRGQQRTAALSTKLAELAYMRDNTGDEPILLLDDVFSELDHLRREYLLTQVQQYQQVFLTATDLTGFPPEIVTQAHLYHVENGTIQEEAEIQ